MILSAPIYVLKRRAREAARKSKVPLNAALDQLARAEGYQSWSHLASTDAATGRARRVLSRTAPGALILIAARPGQGKTLLGLELLLEATADGRQSTFFTLVHTEAETRERLSELAMGKGVDEIVIDTHDALSAAHVIERLQGSAPGAVAIIDYLQLLDQRRDTPPLGDQVAMLQRFAKASGITLFCLSQVDRHYDAQVKPLPEPSDLRLPNPVELNHFDQMLFLQGGTLRLQAA